MRTTITLGEITVQVVRKDIRNVHLSVNPPVGDVRLSAPLQMNLDSIRLFAISKLRWIKDQQRKLWDQERETPREYLNRESHYVWGRRYLLTVVEEDAVPRVSLEHRKLVLHIRPGADQTMRETLLAGWYRDQLKDAISKLIALWTPRLGVTVERYFVQQMKTRWGSCNTRAGTIRLNTELAKKPPECLEYIVVHELVHLLEPTHNARFVSLMDRAMPDWPHRRAVLNRLPVRHERWVY
jgi:predicted metal-dependent hydrolase